ncbi:MAG: hypothetical protein AAB570_04405 [Patescibacteria group bacterium]
MANTTDKPRDRWSAMAGDQKIGFVLFGVVGISGLVLSIIFLLQQMNAPFLSDYDGETFLTSSERELQEIERQQATDTDADGLSDYDEQYVYRTSAYLADSDGDGFDDGQEVNTGNNPNCPAGEACGREVDTGFNSPLRAADVSDEIPFAEVGFGGAIETQEDLEVYLSALTTDQIRTALIQSGVDEATVKGLSDEELRALFDNALKELDESGTLKEILEQ